MTFTISAICMILLYTINDDKYDDTYFSSDGHKVIPIGPFQSHIVWTVLSESSDQVVLNNQPLPGHIKDIRAFTVDTLRLSFMFSGGDPNILFSYNRVLDTFELVADDVVEVTSMDTDPRTQSLFLIDAGKATLEVMDLKTRERQIVAENVTGTNIGSILNEQIPPSFGSPYVQRRETIGKVFTLFETFSGETPQSTLLGHNPKTNTLIFATWDGQNVKIETKPGNASNLKGLEIEGEYAQDVIYVSNQNGIAFVAI